MGENNTELLNSLLLHPSFLWIYLLHTTMLKAQRANTSGSPRCLLNWKLWWLSTYLALKPNLLCTLLQNVLAYFQHLSILDRTMKIILSKSFFCFFYSALPQSLVINMVPFSTLYDQCFGRRCKTDTQTLEIIGSIWREGVRFWATAGNGQVRLNFGELFLENHLA